MNVAAQDVAPRTFDVEQVLRLRPQLLLRGAAYGGKPALRNAAALHPALRRQYAGRMLQYPEAVYGCGVPRAARWRSRSPRSSMPCAKAGCADATAAAWPRVRGGAALRAVAARRSRGPGFASGLPRSRCRRLRTRAADPARTAPAAHPACLPGRRDPRPVRCRAAGPDPQSACRARPAWRLLRRRARCRARDLLRSRCRVAADGAACGVWRCAGREPRHAGAGTWRRRAGTGARRRRGVRADGDRDGTGAEPRTEPVRCLGDLAVAARFDRRSRLGPGAARAAFHRWPAVRCSRPPGGR